MKFEVTNIQFFDQSYQHQISDDEFETIEAYSANLTINNSFIVQVSGNDFEIGPLEFAPEDQYATTEDAQKYAIDTYDIKDIEMQIEAGGIENNFAFLREHAHEII